MDKYKSPKSKIVFEGGYLEKFSATGDSVARISIKSLKSAKIESSIDTFAVAIGIGCVALVAGAVLHIDTALWRWLSVVVFGLGALFSFLAYERFFLVLETEDNVIKSDLRDLPEEGQAFVAMLNDSKKNRV